MMEDDENNPQRPVVSDSSRVPDASRSMKGEFEQTRGSLEERARQLEHSVSVLRVAIESTSDGILFTDKTGLHPPLQRALSPDVGHKPRSCGTYCTASATA